MPATPMSCSSPCVGSERQRRNGVAKSGEPVQPFLDGCLTGEVSDPLFAARFFGIWLAPGTSEPGLRQALPGGGS